jgi:hypothetical protein
MPVISVTRLRVRSWRYLPGFFLYTMRSQRQLRASDGFLRGAVGKASGLAFWTTTAWADEASMKRFRDAGWHRDAMRKLLDWCDEASLARWTQETPDLPDPRTMVERVRTIGRTSKVRRPTAEHAAGRTVPDGSAPRTGPPLLPRTR